MAQGQYGLLTFEEREQFANWRLDHVRQTESAGRLGRSRCAGESRSAMSLPFSL